MNRFLVPLLTLSVVVFGAGCISVEVVKKDTPVEPTIAVDQTATTTNDVTSVVTNDVALDAASTTPAVPSTTSEEPKSVVDDSNAELQLTVSRSPDGVLLSWNERFSDTFAGYKVVRSETETNPSYPKDGALAFLPGRISTTYKDASVAVGKTYYYRVCSIETDMPVACGNVVSVSVQ